ncbi:MAG TPA: L,D-transpeptidase [Acidobacteriaceae bacterium]|jgi:lipoprotein-anchoring transpeptidase ErfK/SrfK|nr:L,D-transpeptidase [Acidobacteriaceae bacterium]
MNDLKKTLIAISCLVLSVVPVQSQIVPERPTTVTAVAMGKVGTQPVSDTITHPTAAPTTRIIVVSLADRRLALMQDGSVKKVYRVAVGKETTPSPTGTFTIMNRVENPTYFHEGAVVRPGPENPVGTRWIGLDKKGYGIHGTNAPHSIGKAASHGCIRMRRRDLEELFAQVRSGDQVEIVGERNGETAAIFGEPGVPAMTAPTQTAQVSSDAPAQTMAADTTATAAAPVATPVSQ